MKSLFLVLALALPFSAFAAKQPEFRCWEEEDDFVVYGHNEIYVYRLPGGNYQAVNQNKEATFLRKTGITTWESKDGMRLEKEGSQYILWTWVNPNFEGYLRCEEIK